MPSKSTKILAVVDDLFFIVKVNDAAKRAGLSCEFVKSQEALIEKAQAERPHLVILDLNCTSLQPLALIESLKGNHELRTVRLIAFVSHVQGELKQQAQAAGADMVMARSAFSTSLPQLLR